MTTSTTEGMEVKVWELKTGSVNDYAGLVISSARDADSGMFDVKGVAISWSKKPKIEVFIEPRKKKPRPPEDVNAMSPGALAMNDRTKVALEPFPSRFGQFLEMDLSDESRWFYNATNLIPCIDEARSAKRPDNSILKEEFFEDRLPVGPAVFKDPRTAMAVLYVNGAGKAELEAIITETAITGLAFVELGPPPKKPRPLR